MLAVVKEGEGRLQEPSALIAGCPHHAPFVEIVIGGQWSRKGKICQTNKAKCRHSDDFLRARVLYKRCISLDKLAAQGLLGLLGLLDLLGLLGFLL